MGAGGAGRRSAGGAPVPGARRAGRTAGDPAPPNSASALQLDGACAEFGVRLGYDTSIADWDTALLLAELGVGRAVVPALSGLTVPGEGALRLIPVPALRGLRVGWAVRRWDALSPAARAFADTVTEGRTDGRL